MIRVLIFMLLIGCYGLEARQSKAVVTKSVNARKPRWVHPNARWWCTRHRISFSNWDQFRYHVQKYHRRPAMNDD